MATASDVDKVRADLAEIGERRVQVTAAVTQLAVDTQTAINKARGVIAMTEVARLVGLERTSMYHTYGSG